MEKKKKTPIIIIAVIVLCLLGTLAIKLVFPDILDIIPGVGFSSDQKWAKMYYERLKSGEYKEGLVEKDKAKAKKIYVVAHENDLKPAMYLQYEVDGKEYYMVFYILGEGEVAKVYSSSCLTPCNADVFYDSVNEKLEYYKYLYSKENKYYIYEPVSYYTNYLGKIPSYYFYDNGLFRIHGNEYTKDKSNTKVNQVLIKVNVPVTSFDFSFDDTDSVIKDKILKAANELKSIEDLTTDELITNSQKQITENNKKKSNSSSSSSSSKSPSGSSSSKNCENPCNCIERKKCPSGFTLICSMEWCEKKDTSISKNNCNDSIAKKYGTPAKGATDWSNNENACYIIVEATK